MTVGFEIGREGGRCEVPGRERAQRTETRRTCTQRAVYPPGREDPVQPRVERRRAAEHPHDVVVHGTRIGLGQAHQRSQRCRRCAGEVGAGRGLGEIDERRPRAGRGPRALVEELRNHGPESRVTGCQGERAFRQTGALDLGRDDAAGHEGPAARAERALHAVEQDARPRVPFGHLLVDVLDHRPGHARVGGDAGEAEHRARGRAGAEEGGSDDDAEGGEPARQVHGIRSGRSGGATILRSISAREPHDEAAPRHGS